MANGRSWILVGCWLVLTACAVHDHPRVTRMRAEAGWRPLAPGTLAPELSLPQPDGTRWTLGEHRGRAVVVAFYRAGW